jgi:adenine-specific DNA-methyltransferase
MTDDRRAIDVLLERVNDAGLREQLRRAMDEIVEEQALGLVFEDHLPEAVRLPGAPIRRGVTVQCRTGDDERIWQVRSARGGLAKIGYTLPDGTVEKRDDVPIGELIVARRLGDPVYPGFTPLDSIERGGDKPYHLVIEGENYHALQTLLYTHESKVDLIYIDPPYNTGAGDWIYNDRYVGDADSFRHSKWLSFMHRRLELAQKLLSPTGSIIVAIDDNEHHRLRMLLDQVFGEQNFLANITWQGGVKNDSRFSSGGADYMLIYAKNAQNLNTAGLRWREQKPGFDEALQAAAAAWSMSDGDSEKATTEYRKWVRSNKGRLSAGITEYTNLDSEGRAWRHIPLISPNPRPTLMYTVLHPVTGKAVRTPDNGWNCSEQVFWERYAAGRIVFGADETGVPRGRIYLDEGSEQSPAPTFITQRVPATYYLQSVLGSKDFPFPKDVDVVARWLYLVSGGKRDAVILDFFAGTGTTAEAVMRLNARDGGRRASIVITNNELGQKQAKALQKAGVKVGSHEWEAEGVFQKVARPRIATVVTRVRRDGSNLAEPVKDASGKELAKGVSSPYDLAENVAFLRLDYLDRDDIEVGAAFRRVAELLWAKAGCVGPVITEHQDAFAMTDHYAVCFGTKGWVGFVDAVNASDKVKVAYIVAASETLYGTVKRSLRDDVQTVHLYDNYLSNFEINTGVAR